MIPIELLPLSFRLLHPIRAGRITTAGELGHELRGLRAANRLAASWHGRIGRRVDRGMRLGYDIEQLCRRALDAESRPRRAGSQLLTASQARRQLDRTPTVPRHFGSRLAAYVLMAAEALVLLTVFAGPAAALVVLGVATQTAVAWELGRKLWQWRHRDDSPELPIRALVVGLCASALVVTSSLIAVAATPLLGAVVLVAPWIVVQQEAGDRSRSERRAADLSRTVLAADRERRRLLRSVDRRIASLGRLGSAVERECERLQFLVDRCYLAPQQDILLARSLAGAENADRPPVMRALPDLTFMVLAISQLEIVTHEASACRDEAYGSKANAVLVPFVPGVPEQRHAGSAACN